MATSTSTLQIGSKTHIGRVREMNQDSFAIFKRAQLLDELDALLIVADGMGGGKGGEVASRIVAETLPDVTIEALADGDGREPDPKRILKSGIQRANNLVRSRSIEKRELEGMGTTCIAAIVNRGAITIGHAGDSRVYLLRNGQLRQVTEDHSQVWQEVLAGKMTREEAQKSKFRNIVTKSVGLAQEVDPDTTTFALEEGDTLLLCSDGLTTEVPDGDIAQILAAAPDAQSACDRLTEAALEAGGSDNITTVVLRYGAFRPIQNAVSISPVPEAHSLHDLPEDATDERADWRNGLPKSQNTKGRTDGFVPTPAPDFRPSEDSNSRNRSLRPPVESLDQTRSRSRDEDDFDSEDEEDEAPRSTRTRKRRPSAEEIEERAAKGGGFLLSVCILLGFVTVGMGIALTVSLQSRTATPTPTIAPPTPANSEQDIANLEGALRTDKDLLWNDPETLYDKPVRDDILMTTYTGDVIVAHPDGTLYSVNKDGKATLIPGPALPKPTEAAKPDALTVFDWSGNRYTYNPKTKKITKFDVTGSVVRSDIGGIAFVKPTRIAISRRGDIFTLDEHRLKRLLSLETSEQRDLDNKTLRDKKVVP